MSYTPTEWKAGDVVTSVKLNKMEQGIVDNNTVIDTCEYIADYNSGTPAFKSTYTLSEILTICKNGKQFIFCLPNQHTWYWGFTAYYPIVSFIYDIYNDEISGGFRIATNEYQELMGVNLNKMSWISEITIDENTGLVIFSIGSDD